MPALIEGLTQLSIVRPEATLSTPGAYVWMAQFLIEKSTQSNDYEIHRKNIGLNIKTQTESHDNYPIRKKKKNIETQTRLKGRAAEITMRSSGSGGESGGRGGFVDVEQQEKEERESLLSASGSSSSASSSSSSTSSLISQIQELAKLLQLGVLTMEEFSGELFYSSKPFVFFEYHEKY